MKHFFLTALLLAPLAAMLATFAPKPTLKSNIILILVFADDLGAKDLSCYGRKDFQTPNHDRMCCRGHAL